MKHEVVVTLTSTFEAHAQTTEGGVEFWLARDLQHLLGYTEWRNFTSVISKAKTACEVSGNPISDHFVNVNKMVGLASGSRRVSALHCEAHSILVMPTKWSPSAFASEQSAAITTNRPHVGHLCLETAHNGLWARRD